MSEEKRRILDMVEQGTITQEDAARLLEALGENEPAPAQPQESQPPQDGTWEAEHQGDEDCQGPNQRVEIHLEGEGATIYQEMQRHPGQAAPVFGTWGKSWRTPSPPPPGPWTPPGPR
ncbi:MAG: SHOCT-like domain-containing protein [Acutalibacter sp.]